MDYKYIEQLLERYFEGETTLSEEQILKTFFSQDEDELPQQLCHYKPLFTAMEKDETLDSSFDEKMLALIGEDNTAATTGNGSEQKTEQKVVKAHIITMRERLQPLFRAAAAVAIVLTLSNAMNLTMKQQQQSDDINYAEYKDTYNDPAVAYEKMENALELISEGFSHTNRVDSMHADSLYSELK